MSAETNGCLFALQVYTWLGCEVELAAHEGDVNDVMDVV